MKKINGFSFCAFSFAALIFLGALLFSGCQNDLLDSPHFQTRGSYATGRVAAPTNLTASQGGYKSITLKWTAAKSAVIYNIYHSDTATGNFEFLGQTSDATCSYTVGGLEPDVKKYYKVQSVDSNSETSEGYSQICFGTTLAAPIITSINQNANGDQITVRWYKGVNCTEETYLNSGLNYTILLYNADGTQVLQETTISALDVKNLADTKYTFKNLTPNTNYCIQIKAYTKSAQDAKSTENSDILNQSTAHSLIPAAPENFQAAKGTSKDGIALSWVLPKFAEIKASTTYETRPVYFKVFRKLESAPETAYDPILTYLGTTDTTIDKIEKNAVHFVKAATESGTEATVTMGASLAGSTAEDGTEIPSKIDVKIEYPEESGAETDPNYPNYIPGTKITLTDKTASRGEKYSYRIQSFIDDNGKKNVTSDESWSDGTGWLINSPTVSVSSVYQENAKDTTKIDSFTVTLNFKFNDFGQQYNYVITETCQEMENIKTTDSETKQEKVGEPVQEKYSSTSYVDFFPWKKRYTTEDLQENHFKYYSYSVSITSLDGLVEYSNIKAPGSIIVTNQRESAPNIDDFDVQDGFSNKFLLSWTYDETCSYKIICINKDKNKKETNIEKALSLEDLKNEKGENYSTGDKVLFAHEADSGDTRMTYTLVASNGFESSKTLDGEYETLGTPEPTFEPDYKSIKVSWKPVQKAVSYKITASYNSEQIKEENILFIKEPDENGNLYCTITEPYGETINGEESINNTTNAAIAGKPIDFKIEAMSFTEETPALADTTTTSEIKISTLGPAATELTVQGAGNLISLKWKKVEGAKGYLIFRKKYSKDYIDMNNKTDIYYYSEEDKNISLMQDDSTPSASCNETAGVFTFLDKYQSAQNYDNQYETDQAQIAWGLPFGYTVIPVLKNTDFEINEDLEILGTDSSIAYTAESLNNIEKQGSTFGYGLALKASKATSQFTVKLKWKAPYNTDSEPMVFKRAYNAKNGTGWSLDTIGTSKDITEIECVPEVKYKAYDYIVCYKPEKYEDLVIDSYFEKYLSDNVEKLNNEKNNKGYIFSFAPITASYNGTRESSDYKKDNFYYSERITWSSYDYTERAVGPISSSIEMLNTNKSAGWVKLADLDINDGTVIPNTEINAENNDLILDSSKTRMLILSPKSIANGTSSSTNGLLKVLRDAKHYYRIRCSFKDENGTTVDLPGDIVYAYRQITDEELIKSTMLVIAELIKDSKMETYGTGTVSKDCEPVYGYTGGADSGKFTWTQDGLSKFNWYISPFTKGWKELPYINFSKTDSSLFNNNLKHFIKISDENSSDSRRGRKFSTDLKFLCYDETSNFNKDKLIPLTVTSTEIPLASYSGTVNFATSDSEFHVKVEHDGTETFTKDVSGKEEVKKWFPAKIGDNDYSGKSSAYGWWED